MNFANNKSNFVNNLQFFSSIKLLITLAISVGRSQNGECPQLAISIILEFFNNFCNSSCCSSGHKWSSFPLTIKVLTGQVFSYSEQSFYNILLVPCNHVVLVAYKLYCIT